MKEVKIFDTREQCNKEKKKRSGSWRSLHTDFIDGKFRVTFVNGNDDPDNSEEAIENRAKFQRKKTLKSKLQDDSISFDELKDLLRGSF